MNDYVKFFFMIGTSTAVMLGLMYLNTYSGDHVFWSETRFYMALLMGAAMALIMLGFMRKMYKSRPANLAICASSAVIFMLALFLVRSQLTVGDTSYMSAMIPHHSIAILTSERAGIDDVRVRELANGIITAQRKEIREMEWLIEDIKANGKVTTEAEKKARPVPPFKGELKSDAL